MFHDGDVLRLLLVEDDEDQGFLVQDQLRRVADGRTETVFIRDLRRACEVAGHGRFDAALLDLGLPDSFGLDTLRAFRSAAPGLPVVVLSGNGDDGVGAEAIRLGAQDYLVKGDFDARLLERTIRHSIERARAEEHRRRSDERLRLLVDQLPAVVWTTDTELRFTSSIGTGLAALALQPGDVVGRSLFDYFATSDDRYQPIAAHLRAITGESSSFDFDWQGQSFHVHVEPLRDDRGHVLGVVGVAVDISDQRRIAENLASARKVQEALYPKRFPEIPGYDLAGAAFPAEETAGDYFDVIEMPTGDWGFVVGDVTGHGLGPALLMTELRAFLRPLCRAKACHRPGEILTLANRFLAEDHIAPNFVTVFLAQLDPGRRILRYAGAGHRGYVLSTDGAVAHLESTGLPMGLVADEPIGEGPAVELRRGDVVLLVTDGFEETLSPSNQLFGVEAVWDVVQQMRTRPAREIVAGLYAACRESAGGRPQQDDMTVVVAKCME